MTYLFSDGFDGHGALADRWDVVDAGASILTDGGKYGTGTHSLRFAGVLDLNSVTYNASPTNPVGGTLNPVHLSFFFKGGGTPSAARAIASLQTTPTGNDGFIVAVNTSGNVALGSFGNSVSTSSAPTGVLGTVAGNVLDDSWHHVEIKYVADSTLGIGKLWLDGILEIDFSGDTIFSGSMGVDGFDKVVLTSANGVFEFDDLLMWDEEGSSMNTSGQLGIHRIETIIPDGDGNSTQLTATGAGTTNADRVDEVDADDDTTYVESSTATNKDLYTYSAMAGTPATVEGVVVHTRGTNPDTGTISFKQVTRSNVTEVDGATFVLPGAGVYGQHVEFVALDPDGSIAWTKTKIDLAEFGVEVV